MSITRVPRLDDITDLIVDAREGGARFNDSTDDSANIQSVIDGVSAAGGGVIQLPPKKARANLVLKSGVYLVGMQGGHGYLPAGVTQATITGVSSGAVIDTPVTAVENCGVVGVNIAGFSAVSNAKGIRFRDVGRGVIKQVMVNQTADEAILLESGCGGCIIEDVLAINAVRNRTRVAVIGAIDIHGNDHWAARVEATISGSIEGTVQSANLYCAAFVWRGANGFIDAVIGEISDIGMYVSGDYNRFSICRADLNYGHGWYITGTSNLFAACIGLNNSQDTTNTYDNWIVTGTAGKNQITGCQAASNLAKVVRYGFNDTVGSAASKNYWAQPISSGAGTADYKNVDAHAGAFALPSGYPITLTANSATPSVSGYGTYATANTSATTISDFTGGVSGQTITVRCGDTNTTIQHNGSTITLLGNGNLKLRSGSVYTFQKVGGTWREVAALRLGVTADVGNAAKTLQARTTEETQIWNTPLTADRAVTLSTTGAFAGARFRIVRTAAATGAFNLNVGSGPLKALAAGQWCDVEYSGTAWVLTAFGSL